MLNFIKRLFRATRPKPIAWFATFPPLNARYIAVSNAWDEPSKSSLR